MIRHKKFSLALAILLALAMVVGVFQSSLAAANITSNSYFLGNQGIYVPGGLDRDVIKLSRPRSTELAGAPVRFTHPTIKLHFKGESGQGIHFPWVLTYVIFNLNAKERRLWESGDLHIYYKDVRDNSWNICSSETFYPKINAPNGRLACLAPQYSIYGVGTAR